MPNRANKCCCGPKSYLIHRCRNNMVLTFLNAYILIFWFRFPWSFFVLVVRLRGIHGSPVNSPHKGQSRGALMFSLICAWINGWVNNREAGDLRRHHAHYCVIVMNNFTVVQPLYIKENIKALRYWPFVRRIDQWPVDFPHKWTASRNIFPCHNVVLPSLVMCQLSIPKEYRQMSKTQV